MSAKINDGGGSAFPHGDVSVWADKPDGTGSWVQHPETPGMTLRDWFAGMALAQIGNEYVARGEVTRQAQEHAMTLAAHAYNIADAMIAARKGGAE